MFLLRISEKILFLSCNKNSADRIQIPVLEDSLRFLRDDEDLTSQ